jgi:hypothetical protein
VEWSSFEHWKLPKFNGFAEKISDGIELQRNVSVGYLLSL